ncbi:DUF4998 domain-containing protein [Chitinophaga qingshengii]|uniref:DUF4998 domain-containing protein n=1 Tax=Chitinophaga qingshengii TaxID=1569794 RepID=A0ABR7TQ94_9BACT|nr:DUF4998 domain-containing protein [Chitinophaga qingshengii]MBC9932148.1 DUF4998 domain-containing protein [Chitinophaga qingshengii]
MKNILLLLGFTTILFSCTKMDAYLDLVGRQEIAYTGRVDSLKVLPGDGRLQLNWLLISDPKISGVTIYYNTKRDSVVIPVKRSEGVDSMHYLFDKMPEGTYSFEVYTWNSTGSRSVPAYISGRSYGNIYKNSLLNRALTNVVISDGNAVLTWGLVEETVTGMEITYTNTGGKTVVIKEPRTTNSTTLPDYKPGSSFSYRTLFRPDTLCIDTFYTTAITRTPQ